MNNSKRSEKFLMALNALRRKKLDKAKDLFSQLLKDDPGNTDASFNLAIVYRESGMRKRAIKIHEGLLEKNRADFESLVALGNLFAEEKNFKKSLEYYNFARKLRPRSSKLLYNIAITLEENKEYEKGLMFYNKAIKLQPRNYDALFRKVLLLEESGKISEAIQAFDQMLSLNFSNDRNAEILYEKGNLLARQEKYRLALDCYNELLSKYDKSRRFLDASENRDEILNILEGS